jgi:hypothetical protein
LKLGSALALLGIGVKSMYGFEVVRERVELALSCLADNCRELQVCSEHVHLRHGDCADPQAGTVPEGLTALLMFDTVFPPDERAAMKQLADSSPTLRVLLTAHPDPYLWDNQGWTPQARFSCHGGNVSTTMTLFKRVQRPPDDPALRLQGSGILLFADV